MILPLPRTGPSSRCRLQLTTQMRLSSCSRAGRVSAPSVSGSSTSPSPMKHQTAAAAGVVDAPVVQVAEEAGVVDRVERPEPHRDGGVLPELGHEPGVGVARQAAADLLAELVEVVLGEPALEEGAGVDARGGVTLDVDGVAGEAAVLAAEEVVEPDVVERGGGGERREVAADAVGVLVGLDDHDRGVPADVGPDAALELLVAGEPGLLLRRDGVDVGRRHGGRGADLQLAGALQQLGHEEAGPGLAVGLDHRVEGLEPLVGLGRVGVGELVHEPVDDHAPMLAPRMVKQNVAPPNSNDVTDRSAASGRA